MIMWKRINADPHSHSQLTPIQMPHVDIEELKQGRKAFTQEEWIKILLRSIGMEPDKLNDRERWLLLAYAAACREQLQPLRVRSAKHG
jgi:ATP-dependent Lon protease